MFGQPLGGPTGRPPAALVPILLIRTSKRWPYQSSSSCTTPLLDSRVSRRSHPSTPGHQHCRSRRIACQKKAVLRQPSSRTTSLLSIRMPAGSLASQSAGCSNVTFCIQAVDASVTSPSQPVRSQKHYLSSQPWEEASSWAFWMTLPEPVRQLRALKAPMRA